MGPLFIAVLGSQCIVLGLICWFLFRRYGLFASDSGSAAVDGDADRSRVYELLARASKALASHSDELQSFDGSIRQQTAAQVQSDPALLNEQLRQIKGANQDVEHSLETTIQGLMATCGDLYSEERASLEAYGQKTCVFNNVLNDVNREPSLVSIVGKLLEMVHELRDENKAVREEVVAGRDKINQLLTRASSAEYIARVDPLTQLPNRRAFDEAHEQCEASLQQKAQPFSVLILDVDHFKLVNDEFGHAAGDSVLSLIARILRENSKTSDHACRLGGEEFAVLLPRCDEDAALRVAEKYRIKIDSAVLHLPDGQQVSVSVSCGVAEAVVNETRSGLLKRADTALYAAKTGGRNRSRAARDLDQQLLSTVS